jgi:SCY1-like protein 1
MPPEVSSADWNAIKKNPAYALDAFDFGILIFETFNGDFLGSHQIGQTTGIPPNMHAAYKRLINANPKQRMSVSQFLEGGKRRGSFFDTPLIKLTDGVEQLGMKSEEEREEFLNGLEQLSDDFPEEYFKLKILPELLKAVEFAGGGPKVFAVVMKIAQKLSDDDYDTRVTPVIVRLFSSPDRAIRVCLLDNLPLMIDRLSQKTVNDKIFPQLVTGFTDLAPLVREQTLKSVLTIVPKLSDRTINGELLKYLAKTANDEQPGIRTNTTICLGKLAKNLGVSNRSKVLIAAFTRSLRDPFVHARNAALLAFAATSDSFSDEDMALKILPAICPLLIDKEKLVRDQAVKTLDVYMKIVRKAASGMADTALPKESTNSTSQSSTPRMGTPQPGEGSAGWGGWAISSFTNKLSAAAGEIEPTGTPVNGIPALKPTPAGGLSGRASASASALHRQAIASPSGASTRTSTSEASNTADYFGGSPAVPDIDDDFAAWGDMDDGEYHDEKPEPKLPAAQPKSLAKPFEDEEPDFGGWLAAQAGRKTGAKPLPKGLAKSGASTTTNGGLRPGQPLRSVSGGHTGPGAGAKKLSSIVPLQPKKRIDVAPKAAEDDSWEGW